MVDSCRSCPECRDGDEQFCTGPGGFVGTYGTTQPEDKVPGGVTMGGYSSDIVVDEAFVIRVPEKMNVAAATPLLCAGITCYSPFKNHGIKAGDHLGIVGLGGLGHMAVKIGVAMGCVVTVITRCACLALLPRLASPSLLLPSSFVPPPPSLRLMFLRCALCCASWRRLRRDPAKVDMAKAMGASKVVISTDEEAMKAAAKSLHYIYNSIAFDHDVQMYLNLLKNKGTMILVGGVPKGAMPQGSFALIGRGLTLAGSLIGGIQQTQDMIDFCAEHDIVCDIELIPAKPEAVDTAWKRTIASDVKFRFVIDTGATL